MPSRSALLRFRLGGERFALRAETVIEVIPAVLPGPLPFPAGVVAGTVVVRGELMALLDVRSVLALPERALAATDHYLVVRSDWRTYAVVTEGVDDFASVDEAQLVPARVLSERGPAGAKIAQLEDGTWAVLDLDGFLSAALQAELDAALAEATPTRPRTRRRASRASSRRARASGSTAPVKRRMTSSSARRCGRARPT